MKKTLNCVKSRFLAVSENESLARMITSGFVVGLGVSPSELADIKTVVSEAVTNSIVHGYRDMKKEDSFVFLELKFLSDGVLEITVRDNGCGIEDVERAMEPFFTTDKEGERSGMGLPIMAAFSDYIKVRSDKNGTCVKMKKRLKRSM